MKTRFPLLVLAMPLVIVFASACRMGSAPILAKPSRVLMFSLAADQDSTWFKGATRFAELVQQRTNGRLVVQVFANALLASNDPVKELEMLREGKIDLSYTSNTLYSNLDQRFAVMSLPWMFSSYADVDRILTGPQSRELLKVCENQDIVGLAMGENGFSQITNSRHEIKTPEDLKGLKIGVNSNKMHISVFSALGAKTSSLPLAETYNALRNAEIDGQEETPDEVIANKLYEVQRYMTIWNYSYSPIVLGVNRGVWNSFDEGTRDILRKAAEEASAFQVLASRKATDEQLKLVRERGISVTVLSPNQIKAFRDLVPSVYKEYEPVIGKEMIERFIARN
jgi:tripartite ATP-independent transporter DctP family solute receptor